MASTGKRVFLSSGAPLTLPGITSTKGQPDQSRLAMLIASFHRSLSAQDISAVTPRMRQQCCCTQPHGERWRAKGKGLWGVGLMEAPSCPGFLFQAKINHAIASFFNNPCRDGLYAVRSGASTAGHDFDHS